MNRGIVEMEGENPHYRMGGGSRDVPTVMTSTGSGSPGSPQQLEGESPNYDRSPQAMLSPNHLGNFKKLNICGKTLLMSPDWTSWFGPTIVTLTLSIAGFALAHDVMRWYEMIVFLIDVSMAFVFSFLCGCTDPGIHPRIADGFQDPLAHEAFQTCRICKVKRPPRAAHCYTCGVCVREHDHHCGIVGGCVGQRTLRYFVAYLVTVSSSALIMFLIVLRSVFRVTVPGHKVHYLYNRRDFLSHVPSPAQSSYDRHKGESISFAMHIVTLMAIGNIALIVGIMAIYYVGLLASDTTRREAQGKRARDGRRYGGWCSCIDNCRRALRPPASILESPSWTTTDGSSFV